MADQRRIILFELNEVPWRVVRYFCERRPDSALARMLAGPHAERFETVSEDVGHLSPWRTWPSLHRGVSDEAHYIEDFGQDLEEVDRAYPPVWRLLQEAGVRVGLFGSLHSYPLPQDVSEYAFYVPDVFAAGDECFPKGVEDFQAFNLAMSRRSALNVAQGVPWREALRFLASAPKLGIKAETALDVGQHLVGERLQEWKTIRRRTYQTVLAFDVFMRQIEAGRPDFATFFTNHVASSMHRYWAAAFPEEYREGVVERGWRETYRDEIDFTMSKADRMIERLKRFVDANDGWALWIASSMGQQAVDVTERATTIKVESPARFFAAAGLEPDQWELRPAMLPQFNVAVVPEARDRFAQFLESATLGGEPVAYRHKDGFFSIDIGMADLHERPAQARIGEREERYEALGLGFMEIQDRYGATAYHIPQGSLIAYDPRSSSTRSEVISCSALDVAPALLDNYAVPRPAHMRGAGLALAH